MKRALAVALSLAMASAPAVEMTLTDEEKIICAAGGGCFAMTKRVLDEVVARAYRAGARLCEKGT